MAALFNIQSASNGAASAFLRRNHPPPPTTTFPLSLVSYGLNFSNGRGDQTLVERKWSNPSQNPQDLTEASRFTSVADGANRTVWLLRGLPTAPAAAAAPATWSHFVGRRSAECPICSLSRSPALANDGICLLLGIRPSPARRPRVPDTF